LWDWIHHSNGCEEVCGEAGSKENSLGRDEALQRAARDVHQQPYMHEVRRLVSGAELFYITNPNNLHCVTVITLILTGFKIKLIASAVTLT
jgi:hypothetical protein